MQTVSTYKTLFVETVVQIACRHGYVRPSISTGQRTKLHYNFIGCPAKITCFKPANSTRVKVTGVNLEHNHEISKAAYGISEITSEEEEVLTNLHNASCKVSQIARVFDRKFDKKFSSQKIRNLL